MTSEEMLKTKLPEGHIFENIAKLGQKPNWKIVPVPQTWGFRVAPGKDGLVYAR